MASVQADLQTPAAVTANPATPVGVATEAVGGVASRIQSSSAVAAASSTVVRSSATPVSSAAPVPSSSIRSSAVASSARLVPSSSSSVSPYASDWKIADYRLFDRPVPSHPAPHPPDQLL